MIVASRLDPASLNIKKQMLTLSDWKESNDFFENIVYKHSKLKEIYLITINDKKINHENLEIEVKEKLGLIPKQVIFISRHTSKTGEPTLTTHPIGNFGKAEFGGKSYALSKSSPYLMTNLLRIMKNNAKKEKLYHKVCFEVTHHGPYLNIPTLFVEVGSNESEWAKDQPAKIVAKSTLGLLENYRSGAEKHDESPTVIGIGGGHYAPRFTDVALEKKVYFGHMIPFYHIQAGNINEKMLQMALEETPNVKGVYIHRKSLKKSQVTEYKNWFEKKGIPAISSKDLENI